MPKRARELSARTVMSLREDGRYAVGGVAGLYLRIEGQSRSWVLRIQSQRKRQEFGLGSFPEVTLAEARDKAWERRRHRRSAAVLLRAGEPQTFIVALSERSRAMPRDRATAQRAHHLQGLCANLYRRSAAGMEVQEAFPAVVINLNAVRLPGDWRPPSARRHHKSHPADSSADLDHEDRDGDARSWTHRIDPRLGRASHS